MDESKILIKTTQRCLEQVFENLPGFKNLSLLFAAA